MADSYLKILQFFKETKNRSQIKPALREMFRVKKSESEIKFYIKLLSEQPLHSLQEVRRQYKYSPDPNTRFHTLSIQDQRDWIAHFAREEITRIFEKSGFNFDVYKMACKSLLRKKEAREKLEEEKKRVEDLPEKMSRKN